MKLLLSVLILPILALWFFVNWPIYADPRFLLPRDNAESNYNLFLYMAEYIRHLGRWPDWIFTRDGGIWPEPLTNNYLMLAPHRLFGLFLVYLTSWPINTIYKFSFLWIGMGVFFYGIFLLAKEIFCSRKWAMLTVGIALVTSIHLGVLHQEEVLGTVFFLPFIWICLLRLNRAQIYWPITASLVGISLNVHYPQLVLLYFILLLALFGKNVKLPLLKTAMVSFFCFMVSVAQLFYSFIVYEGKLFTSDRPHLKLDFPSYQIIGFRDLTSLYPGNLLSYFRLDWGPFFRIGPMDENLLFLTVGVPICLIAALFFGFRSRGKQVLILLALALLSVGIYTPIPKILWGVVPGLYLFRQWYHFLPIFNLHLLFFLVFVIREIRIKHSVFAGLLVLTILVHGIGWSFSRTESFRRKLIVQSPRFEDRELESYARRLIFDRNKLLAPLKIRTASYETVRKIELPGVAWLNEQGEAKEFARDTVTFALRDGKLRLRIQDLPSEARRILLLQHDDGRWKGSQSSWNGLVTFSALPEIHINRERSAWWVLALVMWFPLTFLVTSIFCKRLLRYLYEMAFAVRGLRFLALKKRITALGFFR